MAGFTNAAEATILDGIFTLFGTTLYLGLSSTTPTETGTGITEPIGGGYARVPVTAAEFAAAAGGAPTTKSNDTVLAFPAATADWVAGADLTHFAFFTAATAGTVVAWGALDDGKPVLSGDTPSIPVSGVTLQLGDPADTY